MGSECEEGLCWGAHLGLQLALWGEAPGFQRDEAAPSFLTFWGGCANSGWLLSGVGWSSRGIG